MSLFGLFKKSKESRFNRAVELQNSIDNDHRWLLSERKEFEEIKQSLKRKINILDKEIKLSKSGDSEKEDLRKRIEGKLRKQEIEFEKSVLDKTKEIYKNRLELSKLVKDEEIDTLLKSEQELNRIGSSYEIVVQAYSEGKIDKRKFSSIRKETEKKLKSVVHYSDMLVLNKENKLLLLKRNSEDDMFPSQWCLPGGHVDPGEEHKSASIRELAEETLIEVKEENVNKAGEYINKKVHIEYYRTYIDSANLVLNNREHECYEWVDINVLEKYDLILNLRETLNKIFNIESQPVLLKKTEELDIEKALGIVISALNEGSIQYEDIEKSLHHKYINKKIVDGKPQYTYDVPKGKHKSIIGDQNFDKVKEVIGKIVETKENKTETDYEQIRRTADDIINGSKYIERLSPEEEQGRIKGGRINVESTLLLRGKEITGDEDELITEKLIEEQEGILKDYAKNNGLWIDNNVIDTDWKLFNSGEEAKVYDDGSYVKKVFDYQMFSLSPMEFIDNRISLHNFMFKETSYELIGFTETNKGLSFILKQPYIRDYSKTELPVIKKEMKKRGFKELDNKSYYNDNYLIEDLHSKNVITNDNNDKLYFIDTVISLNEKGEGYDGIREYKNIEVMDTKIEKAFQTVKLGYEQGLVSEEVFEKAQKVYSDNAENKRLHRVGMQYGSNKQEDQSKVKVKSEEDGNKNNNNQGQPSLEDFAKKTSEEDLQRAAKGEDPELRKVAKIELERRDSEETGTDKEVGKDNSSKSEENKIPSDKEGNNVVDKFKDKIKGWSEKEKEFFNKGAQEKGSPERRNFSNMIKDKAKGIVKLATHEVKEWKEAGVGIGKLMSGQKISEKEKKAVLTMTKHLAITVGTIALTGGAGHLIHAGLAGASKAIFVHYLEHAGVTALGKALVFASEEDELGKLTKIDPEKALESLLNGFADYVENEDFTDEKWVEMFNDSKSLDLGENDNKDDKVEKAIQTISLAFIQGMVTEEVLEKAHNVYKDTAENRRLHRVGRTWGGNKQNTSIDKKEGREEDKKESSPTKEKSLEEHAKNTSDDDLIRHSKGDNEEMRVIAHKELKRRKTEHKPGEEIKEKEITPAGKKADSIKDKIEELSDKYKSAAQEAMNDDFTDSKKTSELDKKQKEYSRYLWRTKEFTDKGEPIDKEAEIKNACELLGLKDEKEIKEFFGDGDVLGITVEDEFITIMTEDCYCQRGFDKENGVVEMLEFILNPDLEKGLGKGTEIFSNQINSFKKLGYKKVITDAAKSDIYNGYYTWARLGYNFKDGNEKESFIDIIEGSGDKDIKNIESLSELMTTPKGREFWKENGFRFKAEFDLSESSQSMFILNEYMKEKKNGKK